MPQHNEVTPYDGHEFLGTKGFDGRNESYRSRLKYLMDARDACRAYPDDVDYTFWYDLWNGGTDFISAVIKNYNDAATQALQYVDYNPAYKTGSTAVITKNNFLSNYEDKQAAEYLFDAVQRESGKTVIPSSLFHRVVLGKYREIQQGFYQSTLKDFPNIGKDEFEEMAMTFTNELVRFSYESNSDIPYGAEKMRPEEKADVFFLNIPAETTAVSFRILGNPVKISQLSKIPPHISKLEFDIINLNSSYYDGPKKQLYHYLSYLPSNIKEITLDIHRYRGLPDNELASNVPSGVKIRGVGRGVIYGTLTQRSFPAYHDAFQNGRQADVADPLLGGIKELLKHYLGEDKISSQGSFLKHSLRCAFRSHELEIRGLLLVFLNNDSQRHDPLDILQKLIKINGLSKGGLYNRIRVIQQEISQSITPNNSNIHDVDEDAPLLPTVSNPR